MELISGEVLSPIVKVWDDGVKQLAGGNYLRDDDFKYERYGGKGERKGKYQAHRSPGRDYEFGVLFRKVVLLEEIEDYVEYIRHSAADDNGSER